MKKVKLGDYIRTTNGFIAKVINISNFREPLMKYGIEADYIDDIAFIGDKHIKKYSSNIIDCIEIGDFVEIIPSVDLGFSPAIDESRIFEVCSTDIKDFKNKKTHEIGVSIDCDILFITEKYLLAVLTREQFDLNKHKIDIKRYEKYRLES